MCQTEITAKIIELKKCFKELEKIDVRNDYIDVEKTKELLAKEMHRVAELLNTNSPKES